MELPARFKADSQWAFVPGPVDQSRPISSLDVQEIVSLPAEAVAESFLAFPGMQVIQPAEPDWWAWRARWESGSDFIALEFTLFDVSKEIWGGSPFTADCSSASLLALLHHLNQQHGGIWLHDPDCGMHAGQHLSVETGNLKPEPGLCETPTTQRGQT